MTMTAVAAGGSSTAAIDDAGRLWVSGLNTYGKFGLGDSFARHVFTVTALRDVVAVAVSAHHVVALDTHGVVHGAGRRRTGNRSVPLCDFTAIADGAVHISCGGGAISYVRVDGTVWLNNPHRCELTSHSRVDTVGDAVTISSHGTRHVIIDTHGTATVLHSGGVDDGVPQRHTQRVAVERPARFRSAVTSAAATLYVDDHGDVWAHPATSGHGDAPTARPVGLRAQRCALGHEHSLYVDDGTLVGLGANSRNQLGAPQRRSHTDPFDTASPLHVDIRAVDVACGNFHSVALDDTGELWVTGANNHGQLGSPGRTASGFTRVEAGTPTAALAAELGHTDSEIAYSYALADLAQHG
jgi:hypothetical protein